VRVTVRNLQKKVPINQKRIRKTVLDILSCEGVKKSGEVIVSFVSDKEIRELNLLYLGLHEPTDVLAFDISGPTGGLLADIVISTDAALRNSKAYATTALHETHLYVIHGILHLLGYRDNNAANRRLMRRRESFYTERSHVNT